MAIQGIASCVQILVLKHMAAYMPMRGIRLWSVARLFTRDVGFWGSEFQSIFRRLQSRNSNGDRSR